MSPSQEDVVRNCGDVPVSTDKSVEDQDKKVTYEENGLIPQHLPKKQRELFLRIQQQQREADNSQTSANDEDDEEGSKIDENWYSSDEETSPSPAPLPSIFQNLTQSSSASTTSTATSTSTSTMVPLLNLLANASAAAKPMDVNKTPAPTSFIPSNLDLTNLSLSTVFEALTNLKKMSSSNQVEQQPTTTSVTTTAIKTENPVEIPKSEPVKPELPRVRDPRLRAEGGSIESHRGSIESPVQSDVDLRLKSTSTVKPQPTSADVDLRSLPFKPVQHSAANEIDASLTSHTPMSWQLQPADVIKPDYNSLQIQPKPGVNDPRLRRAVRPSLADDLGLPRDPRQRLLDEPVRDPRARQPLLATPLMPPATPRYDEDHRPQFYRMDSDMRQFPPPTPRQDDEVYTPGPSRPVDPRQRSMSFPSRPDDIDLRTQMAHRVPFINYNK
ncbi:Zinc finger CCCH domain-containing protein 6 [Homalodisca vitripennis]|nr:Zinc finger CCCH domain-containing protein 6 [Homalodisca vitripennis]